MKTSELVGTALDWAVAKAKQLDIDTRYRRVYVWTTAERNDQYEPSTDWFQGGPIIESENIALIPGGEWGAVKGLHSLIPTHFGQTPLIAAMRAFVASKLGDEIEVPENLL